MYTFNKVIIFLGACSCISGIDVRTAIGKYSSWLRPSEESLTKIEKLRDSYVHGEPRDEIGDQIKSVIECIGGKLREGNASLGIPSLDPLVIDSFSINFDNFSDANGAANVFNFQLKGLTNFEVFNSSLEMGGSPLIALLIGLSFENITIKTEYSANVVLFDMLSIFSDGGEIELAIPNISISVMLDILGLEISSIDWNVDKVTLNLTGLLNDDRMSGLIGNMLASIINEVLENLKENDLETAISVLDFPRDSNSTIIDDLIDMLLPCLENVAV